MNTIRSIFTPMRNLSACWVLVLAAATSVGGSARGAGVAQSTPAAARPAADPPAKPLPLPGEVFTVQGRTAFLIPAQTVAAGKAKPWVWYAPTLPGLPGEAEKWMFEQFTEAGIAIAGIDVGESYGSPDVKPPVAVRYAWEANPAGNLVNGAGLPASPFRTDDWPITTATPVK
jgi:hypothetical protein